MEQIKILTAYTANTAELKINNFIQKSKDIVITKHEIMLISVGRKPFYSIHFYYMNKEDYVKLQEQQAKNQQKPKRKTTRKPNNPKPEVKTTK